MVKIDEAKITAIKQQIPDLKELDFYLSQSYAAMAENYRHNIRAALASEHSFRFSRQQLADLADLNKRPAASQGYFSISHCPSLGGFSYSNLKHGFDLENVDRISKPIILRTCTEEEVAAAPNAKFLWVAKEAALKALSPTYNSGTRNTSEPDKTNYVITDFQTENWKSQFETGIFSYRVTSDKTLDLSINKGYVFSEKDVLFSVFFK